jgi:putative transposase
MATTLTELLYHCIWSTKNRDPLIRPEIEENVWRILAGTAKRNEMRILNVGGIENHVHVLVRIPKTMSVSEAMQRLKGGSSKAINNEELLGSELRFAWQDGYGAFTVSKSNVPDIERYVLGQREHHRVRTFEDEFVEFLDRHEIDYDPKYLWD